MAERCITIQTRLLGGLEVPAEDQILRVMEERLTAAELIRRVVEERIREITAFQRLAQLAANQSETLLFLAANPTNSGMKSTKPLLPRGTVPPSLPQAEVEKALHAFEARHYLLLVNNQRVKSLDEEIALTAGVQIQFLRLTPLVGG
jgi:hypothetical protein